MHLRAYDAYCKRYGKQEALIEGWCRGGFGTCELDMFIPGWREEISVLNQLKAEAEKLREQGTALRELVELKDLRAKIDGPKEAFRDDEDYEAAVESYYSRKAVAWGAARAALSSENASVDLPGDPDGPKTNSDVAAG